MRPGGSLTLARSWYLVIGAGSLLITGGETIGDFSPGSVVDVPNLAAGLAVGMLTFIVRGEWVTLLGHYDDPRSNECPQTLGRDMTDAGSVAATIISCRSAFVLDEVRPPVAP